MPTAANVRATEAELRAPAVAGAARAPAGRDGRVRRDGVRARLRGRARETNCERPTPRGSVQKGDMPCCHFSHRGPYLWGAAQCFAMVRAHEHRSGKRFRWIVRARPDYLPQEDLIHAIRGRCCPTTVCSRACGCGTARSRTRSGRKRAPPRLRTHARASRCDAATA